MITDYRSANIIPFDYVIVAPATAANGSIVTTLTLATDSEFELHTYFGASDQDTALSFGISNFSIQIIDQSTGRQLSNARVPQSCFCGPHDIVYRLARPVIFMPGAVLAFDILDLSAHINIVTIVLRGFKIFKNQ
jgi:hypothetical protein